MDLKEGNKNFINKINNDINLKNKRDGLIKDIFVIRTAGNVINEGELATVEYAIEHLKVKRIIVLGHTHCGAIHASIHKEKGRYLDPILNRIKCNIGEICNELEASKINAIKEAAYIKEKFPQYEGIIESKIYDIETSIVY